MLEGNFCVNQKIEIHKGKERSQRIIQLTHRFDRQKERQLYRQGLSKMNLRRAQTRNKVQWGGLIVKAELPKILGIDPYDNLQKNELIFDEVATLYGALLDLAEPLQNDPAQKLLWKERGKKALAQG